MLMSAILSRPQRLEIPCRLPGYNELAKGVWRQRAKLKKDNLAFVRWQIRKQKIQVVDHPVFVVLHFVEANRRRDLDNISGGARKIIMDAFQPEKKGGRILFEGVIPDDGWRWVVGYLELYYIEKAPRVIVDLIPTPKLKGKRLDAATTHKGGGLFYNPFFGSAGDSVPSLEEVAAILSRGGANGEPPA